LVQIVFGLSIVAKLGNTQVAVEISSVIRASPNSFRVAWTERRYDNGQLAATERWTAIISIARRAAAPATLG
jgi:type IV secretory pathway TrbF-like protein